MPYHIGMIESLNDVLLFLESTPDEEGLKQAHLGNALSTMHVALGEKSWVGLYLATPTRLILGPFQGTPACEIIAFGKGVVGTSYSKADTIAVEDVSNFPGYICCDASAKSEICLPVLAGDKTLAILDIDLPDLHNWKEEEIEILKKIAANLARFL